MWWTHRRGSERNRRMRAERERHELERRCAALVGDVLRGVRYVEGDYAEPLWNVEADYDSIDQGLELDMQSGRTFAFFWASGAVDFEMNVAEGEVPVIEGVPRLDVGGTSRWTPLLGRQVTACRVLWRPIEGTSNEIASQTIRLDFDGDRVLVTAAEFDGVGPVGADHVSVFFGDAWERRSDLTGEIDKLSIEEPHA